MNVKNTKVYRLFAALGGQERKDFARFLRRHSRPKREQLRGSLRFLGLQSARIEAGLVSNEEWWAAVFPGEPYFAPHFRRHQNKLVADLETFLMERALWREDDPYLGRVRECEQLMLLLSELLGRGEDNLLDGYLRRTESLVEQLPQDQDREALRLRIAMLKLEIAQRRTPYRVRPEYAEAQASLDNHYLINCLKLEVANRNLQAMQPQQPSLGRVQVVMPAMPLGAGGELANAYRRLLDLPMDIEEPELTALVTDVVACEHAFAPEVWKDMLYICLNLAIGRINAGKEEFRLPVLHVYMALLRAGLLQRDMSAFRQNFLNIVKLAFFRDPPEELARYVRAQQSLIEGDPEYGTAVRYFSCLEQFAQRDYKKCINCFGKVWLLEGGRSVRYASGVMLLKSLYEARDWERLQDFAGEFKKIIQRDPAMAETKRVAILRFLHALQVLQKLQFQGINSATRRQLRALRAALATDKGLMSWSWLQEKVAAWP